MKTVDSLKRKERAEKNRLEYVQELEKENKNLRDMLEDVKKDVEEQRTLLRTIRTNPKLKNYYQGEKARLQKEREKIDCEMESLTNTLGQVFPQSY